jgi:hypothetical protein
MNEHDRADCVVVGGGLAGRPGPAVPGSDNLYVAGDWVGREGMLAAASLASARSATLLILRGCGTATAPGTVTADGGMLVVGG